MKGDKLMQVYLLLLLLALSIPVVLADGDYDDLLTSVIIGDTAPTVGEITCDTAPLSLNAETIRILNCNATVSDENGYETLANVRAEFYNDSLGASANYTKHYYNNTCTYIDNGTSSTDSVVECQFAVYYHANPAVWTVYFNVSDGSGLTGNNTTTLEIADLVALNVTNETIDFLTVGLNSESTQITTAIKNTGNVELDIQINESLYQGNMSCDGVGSANITTDAASTGVRYNTTSGFTFDDANWQLSENNNQRNVNWSKSSIGTGTATPPEYNLYWKIKIPASGVSGTCTTTTRISATKST